MERYRQYLKVALKERRETKEDCYIMDYREWKEEEELYQLCKELNERGR